MEKERSQYREAAIHGDADFPMQIYRVHQPPEGMILPIHWHDELELVLMERGSAVFQLDGTAITACAGEAVWIRSGQIHVAENPEGGVCAYAALVFDAVLCGAPGLRTAHQTAMLRQRNPTSGALLRPGVFWQKQILENIRRILETEKSRLPGWELEVQAGLSFIAALMIRHNPQEEHRQKPGDAENIARLKQVVDMIRTGFHRPVTLGEMAAVAGMNPQYFCRFFKRMTGRTPVQYLNEYRVNQAMLLLEDTRRSILDVSMDCGFENVSYFIRTFRGLQGVTPGVWQRRGRQSQS